MDEIQSHSRMGCSCNSSAPEHPSTHYHGADTVSREAFKPKDMESSDAPVCSVSDVWPEEKDVQPLRVLHADEGRIPRPTMPRRDRRGFFKKVGGVSDA